MILSYMLIKIKSFLGTRDGQNIAIILVIILVAIASFILGRFSLSETKTTVLDTSVSAVPQIPISGSQSTPSIQNVSSMGPFVASRNGTKYYTKDCSGARRIKPENLISFTTKEQAEQAGYTWSSTCK